MNVLGIHDGWLATAALLVDGKIVSCVSEERFTKKKNQSGLPVKAIKYCLQATDLKLQEIDLIVFSSEVTPPLPPTSKVTGTDYIFRTVFGFIAGTLYYLLIRLQIYFPFVKYIKEFLYLLGYRILKRASQNSRRNDLLNNFPGFKGEIIFQEHHLSHVYAAIFGSELGSSGRDLLVLTADGEGDKLSATVGTYKEGYYERISTTSLNDSLGLLYLQATIFLGMKPKEHEYKVMGLAPYPNKEDYQIIYKKMKELIWVDHKSLKMKMKIDAHLLTNYFHKHFKGVRFDWFAAAVQQVTEEILVEWIQASVKKTKLKTVVCSGGVFMNVKANQRILELKEVEKAFFLPSCGDESNAIGACFWGYYEIIEKLPQPLINLSLGPSFTSGEIEKLLKKTPGLEFKKVADSARVAARLLAQGEVVALFQGKAEFGARALGNRSLLARGDSDEIVDRLNKMIKIRDFWMPFAPVVLEERKNDYFIDSGKTDPYFMMATYDSKVLAQKELRGGMHKWDKTLRVQVINKKINPYYYRVVKEFERITGIGGLINTSFNLHGEPIVTFPEDALRTLKNSGLKYLLMEDWLVTKKS